MHVYFSIFRASVWKLLFTDEVIFYARSQSHTFQSQIKVNVLKIHLMNISSAVMQCNKSPRKNAELGYNHILSKDRYSQTNPYFICPPEHRDPCLYRVSLSLRLGVPKATIFAISHNVLHPCLLHQVAKDLTAVATSCVAIFSHAHFSFSSFRLRKLIVSYSFRDTALLISAYCSLVISIDFQ